MLPNKIIFLSISFISIALYGMEEKKTIDDLFINPAHIISDNIDELIIKGIDNIQKNGEYFKAKAGNGQQAYDVTYTLTNPKNRVHNLRAPQSTKYLSREFLAYFKGSLKVNEGLSQASKIWDTLKDENGEIASNYGYYVFHQKQPNSEKTQYNWVIDNLSKNLDSRKAFININQVHHKKMETKDFPCTLGMQFYTKKDHLCCSVSSRSTDIYTGLPYDMGFFSFVNELVYKDLKESLGEKAEDLKLEPVSMKTNFTQIYDKTRTVAVQLWQKNKDLNFVYKTDMPPIYDAKETLNDIYNQKQHTPVMKWIYKHADFKN